MSFEGIPFPEIVVREIADTAIRNVVGNLAVLDLVMGAMPQRDKDSLRTALKKRPIQTRIGYGLENPEDAQITVMLAGTMALGRTLGDVVGMTEEVPTFSTTLSAGIGLLDNIVLPLTAAPSTGALVGRVRIDDEVGVYSRAGSVVTLLRRGLQGTTAAIHGAGDEVVFHDVATRIGWGESCDVRLDVLSSNPMLNLVLAGVVKAALLMSAATFDAAGLTLRDIRETDLAPRPQMWPAELLNRALLISVQRDYALPESFKVLTKIDLVVEVPT